MKEEQIIKSAKELFLKYGYKKVSMSEIAENANITKRTLYSYFKDKDDILNYIIEEEITNMKQIIDEIEKEDLPFLKKVHKTILKIFEYKKQKQLLTILTQEYKKMQNPKLNEKLKRFDENIQDYIKERVHYAMENGYIKKSDPDIISFIIYKIYIALVFEWEENNDELDEKEITDNIMHVLSEGLFIKKDDINDI